MLVQDASGFHHSDLNNRTVHAAFMQPELSYADVLQSTAGYTWGELVAWPEALPSNSSQGWSVDLRGVGKLGGIERLLLADLRRAPPAGETHSTMNYANMHGYLDVAMSVAFILFGIMSIEDVFRFRNLMNSSDKPGFTPQNSFSETPRKESGGSLTLTPLEIPKELPQWSLLGLIGITAYRFYTGFLSATWLPYLLAMEGEDLWRSNQSLFMGVAKLIYGVTILINPLCGLIGDRLIVVSHGIGRRLFVRLGVLTAAVGIFVCIYAARHHLFHTFLFGILMWRLGESVNDVTLEAIVPELVPSSQYPLASSVKALLFLCGGLFGYVLLIFMVNVHYSWLYYAYFTGMLTCAIPSMILLSQDHAVGGKRGKLAWDETVLDAFTRAYITPAQSTFGFPRFCMATFVFMLGTSPMFFLLLMVRDLVGISDTAVLQREFSVLSINFFASAAVASVLSGVAPKTGVQVPPATEILEDGEESPGSPYSPITPSRPPNPAHQAIREQKVTRWRNLIITTIIFGLVVLAQPSVALLGSEKARSTAFFVFSIIFGATFGSGYARFQDALWQVLPAGQDKGQANSMGFNTMCRLLGLGVGNFCAGLILDCFYTGNIPPELQKGGNQGESLLSGLFDDGQTSQIYTTMGYVLMCSGCAVCNLISAALLYSIPVDKVIGTTTGRRG